MKAPTLALAALLLAIPSAPPPESIGNDPRVVDALNLLDVWIDAQQAYRNIPGISVAVVYDQELLWSRGFGYADVDRQIAATPTTMYSICSISKLFTSVGVMQLRDQGHLRLDDPVADHLPWFDIEDTYPDAPPVKVQGLLTHSSGLPRESDYPYWTGPFDFPTHDQIVDRISHQSELYPADRVFQYSNLGLTLAGEIVAQESGMAYGEYIRANILEPLGMDDTSPEIPVEHRGGRFAQGYSATRRDGTRREVEFFQANGIAPAAGFSSTVEDLAKFASWQFRLLENGGTEVLNANTLREMHRVHWVDPNWRTTWGLGFSVSRGDDKTFVGHGGSCPGFRSNLRIQTDDKIATIAMANASGVNPTQFTQRAYDIVAPAIAAAKENPDEGKTVDPELMKFVGVYDSYPWGGEQQVIPWKGSLARIGLPTDNPLEALTKLKHVEGNTFRRIRDDKSLAEEITFELDQNGEVLRMKQHSNYSERLR
jgi:CubicO group peptidase (beta-lactamase class C family)